jgi:hypothetical protein
LDISESLSVEGYFMSISSINGQSAGLAAQSGWPSSTSEGSANLSVADTTSVSKLANGSTVTIERKAGDAIVSVTTAATTSSDPPTTTTSTVDITA